MSSTPSPSDNSTTTPSPDSSPPSRPPNSTPPPLSPDTSPSGNSTPPPNPLPLAQPPSPDSSPLPPTPTSSTPLSPNSTTTATPPPNTLAQPPSPDSSPPPPTPISSTPLSPNSSPSDNSITPSPTSNPSAPPPIPDPSPPPPTPFSSPPLRSPNSSTPPPPPDSPPPKPDSPVPVTPPQSNKEPPPPPSNVNKPPSPPPPTPNAPPPIDISPPPPIAPISHPRQSPSPPLPSGPGAPTPTHTSSPPPLQVSPEKSPPVPTLPPPTADLPAHPPSSLTPPNNATFSPPLVPGYSSPPLQSNTPIQEKPTSPSEPSTPPGPNNTTASTTREAGGFPTGGAIAIVLVGVLALCLVVFAAWFVHRRKKKRTRSNHGYMVPSPFVSSQNSDSILIPAQNAAIGSVHESSYHSANLNGSSSTTKLAYAGEPGGMGNSRSWFTYEELVGATNGFSEDNLLGEGGFGCVYKGNLADGREVAVKQLKIGSGQGEREFRAEVEIISRIHHRHLVSIVGYCISDSRRLLVYDYVPNNTLHYHLHGNVSVMSWASRFKVAAGAARGIAYLHEDCTPRIIHRDIKSANILLDNNFEAKVADFGLAKLVELEARTHVSTRVMGTFGYMAPEYATTGKLTEKSDVFSFGVVLLELITGRKPVDSSQPLGDESLVEWARPLLAEALKTESFENLVDPRLENNYVKIEMLRLTEAAAACVRHSATKRPKMSQVARAVDGIGESSDLTNGMKPGDSQIIDSREQSAQIRMFQRMAFGNQEYGTDSFSNSQNSWSGS